MRHLAQNIRLLSWKTRIRIVDNSCMRENSKNGCKARNAPHAFDGWVLQGGGKTVATSNLIPCMSCLEISLVEVSEVGLVARSFIAKGQCIISSLGVGKKSWTVEDIEALPSQAKAAFWKFAISKLVTFAEIHLHE